MDATDRRVTDTVRVYANAARYVLSSRYHESDLTVPLVGGVEPVDESRLDRVLATYDEDVVFVHAGLSDVASAFDRNPYRFLLGKLTTHFESVLAPGFTPSFRTSGVYHKQYSRPEYGTFARLFLDDADYRTDDPIHSILVRGDYRFEDCDHRFTFGPEGCWAKLDRENVRYLNVGTPWIVATQHHYVEHYYDVPYNDEATHDGVVFNSEDSYETVEQRNYTYRLPAKRSARKIQSYLEAVGVLDSYDLGGLSVLSFRARDLRLALAEKLAADPYWLIT